MRGLLVGGIGAPLALTFHSVVDFPLQSPAIAATFAVLAALLCKATRLPSQSARPEPVGVEGDALAVPGAVRHRGSSSRRSPNGEFYFIPPRATLRTMVAAAVVGILWLVACGLVLDPLRGQLDDAYVQRVRSRVALDAADALPIVESASEGLVAADRGDAGFRADLADLAMDAAAVTDDPAQRLQLADRALKLRTSAVLAEPMNGQHPFWLAAEYLSFGRVDMAVAQAKRACGLLPNDPFVRAYLAEQFRAYGWTDLARGYIDEANRLAEERHVAEAGPLIQTVRQRICRGGRGRHHPAAHGGAGAAEPAPGRGR